MIVLTSVLMEKSSLTAQELPPMPLVIWLFQDEITEYGVSFRDAAIKAYAKTANNN